MSERHEQPTMPMASIGAPPNGSQTRGQAIDLEKLTEKVYQLWRADARLSRARGETRTVRR